MTKNPIRNKRGEMYVRACVCVMLLSMTFVIVLSFAMTTALARGQRKGAMQALDNYTQKNAIQIFDNIKNHSDETNSLDPTAFMEALCIAQSLTPSGNVYQAPEKSNGDYQFIITNVQMSYVVENTTKIYVSYTLSVPFNLAGRTIWMDVPITISTKLDPKFELPTQP